jgi:hypothetical protein
LEIIKESFLTVLVFIFLEDIDGQNYRASSYLGRLIFKESGVIELELTDLEAHINDGFVRVVV